VKFKVHTTTYGCLSKTELLIIPTKSRMGSTVRGINLFSKNNQMQEFIFEEKGCFKISKNENYEE